LASITISNLSIIAQHTNVPFEVPAGVYIRNKSSLLFSFKLTWSGYTTTTKKHIASVTLVSDSLEQSVKVFEQTNTSTAKSGTRTYSATIPLNETITNILTEDEALLVVVTVTFRHLDNNPVGTAEDGSNTINLASWDLPQITVYDAYRVNEAGDPLDSGTKVRISFAAATSPLTGYGTSTFSVTRQKVGDTEWTPVEIVSSGNSISLTGVDVIGDFPLNESHLFKFNVNDGYVYAEAIDLVGTGYAVLHGNANKDGLAIGKYSEGPGFDVGWASRFRDDVQFDAAPTYVTPADARTNLGISLVNLGIQTGTASFSVPANDSVGVDITFTNPYAADPVVQLTLEDSTVSWGVTAATWVAIRSPATTGFTARVFNSHTDSRSGNVHWTAFGELA
jgi:hypothetical protein